MLIKVSNATNLQIDWLVCEAAGMFTAYKQFRGGKAFLRVWGVAKNTHFHPSTDWAQGGPIIEREGIVPTPRNKAKSEYGAFICSQAAPVVYSGPTPLIAAMRCFVASKLGDEVDVPEELT